MAVRDLRNCGDDGFGGGWRVARGASYYDWRHNAGGRAGVCGASGIC